MRTPRISRREFLRKAGQAGLGLGLGSHLVAIAGCSGGSANLVAETPGGYDAIVVGGGAAGAIVAAKLQIASGGRKRILIIEAGGPTSAAIGGTDFPVWLPPNRTDLTIHDVPGEYSLLAFQPLGAPYQLTETLFTWQGIGLGGNAMYNGMLFQTNPSEVFDNDWPTGWHSADLAPYFQRVRGNIPVTNTPSTDGVPQNTGPADIIHPLYAANGWMEGDTSMPINGPGGLYSRPYVAATSGRRAGPISGYFEAVDPGGVPVTGLEIIPFAKCERIHFNADSTAVAVSYSKRAGLDQSTARHQGRRAPGSGWSDRDGGGSAGHAAPVALERSRTARPRGRVFSGPHVGAEIYDRQSAGRRRRVRPRDVDDHLQLRRHGAVPGLQLRRLRRQRGGHRRVPRERQRTVCAISAGFDSALRAGDDDAQRRDLSQSQRRGHAGRNLLWTAHVFGVLHAAQSQGARADHARYQQQRELPEHLFAQHHRRRRRYRP